MCWIKRRMCCFHLVVASAVDCRHSYLFVSGSSLLWFTGAIKNGPNFHPNLFMVEIIGYRRPAASHVGRSSRTLLTVRPARQDAVRPRRQTTKPTVKVELQHCTGSL